MARQTTAKKLDDLMNRWKNSGEFQSFIKDGIVDPENYEFPHILFVLRDMNCKEECDLCKSLRETGEGWQTWNNIARWTMALLDGDEEYPRSMPKEKRIEQLKRVAVLNLKKEGGGSRSKGDELIAATKQYGKFIKKEISLCDPDIIICCGLSSNGIEETATLLKDYVFENDELVAHWKTPKLKSPNLENREWSCYLADINDKLVAVVNFCHPQVTNLEGNLRGHDNLFEPLYRDMLYIRNRFRRSLELRRRAIELRNENE